MTEYTVDSDLGIAKAYIDMQRRRGQEWAAALNALLNSEAKDRPDLAQDFAALRVVAFREPTEYQRNIWLSEFSLNHTLVVAEFSSRWFPLVSDMSTSSARLHDFAESVKDELALRNGHLMWLPPAHQGVTLWSSKGDGFVTLSVRAIMNQERLVAVA